MLAEVMTIGDEILIGQVIDSNSAWIATELNDIGCELRQITSISDRSEHIVETLDKALLKSDLIIITGGLGPTRDDITKQVLADYFDTKLVLDQGVLDHVEHLFSRFGKPMPDVNRYQAIVPANAKILKNREGTAPGMLFQKGEKWVVSLPGVPYEMKGIMTNELLPLMKAKWQLPAIYHRTILTQGVGESTLMGYIAKWESGLEQDAIKLAYLPSPGVVRLRLSGFGEQLESVKERVDSHAEVLKSLIAEFVFGENSQTLEEVIGELLLENKATLATAESCTGGYLAHLITSIPGSSRYFCGTVVSYSNAMKQSALGVKPTTLQKYGAVSEQVAIEMAKGILESTESDYAISTTGIAGPDGGTNDKPVGTVWIGIASTNRIFAKQFRFGHARERNIRMTSLQAMSLLRKEIIGNT